MRPGDGDGRYKQMSGDLPIGTEPSAGRFKGLYRGHMERREKVKMDIGSYYIH